jgi:hypothetical protein
MSIVQWWGANADRYPVWALLALDYLSVMATSVSSERALDNVKWGDDTTESFNWFSHNLDNHPM